MKKITCLLFALLFLLAGCRQGPDLPGSGDAFGSARISDVLDGTDASPGSSVSDAVTDSEPAATDPVGTDSNPEPKKLTPSEVLAKTPHLVGLTDQKNERLIVADLNSDSWKNDAAVVWEFKDARCKGAAGIKFRNSSFWGGDVVLFCGPKAAGIISYQTKEMLYFTTKVGSNPHEPELLPDGNLVVASSTDGIVHLFAATTGNLNPVDSVYNIPSAHGALWDPANQLLWLAGGNVFAGYQITGTTQAPRFQARTDLRFVISDGGIHDLSPVYGNPSRVWLTTSGGVYQIEKLTGQKTKVFSGASAVAGKTYVPGVGNYPDGVVVYVVPNKVFKDWCSDRVLLYVPGQDGTEQNLVRTVDNDAYYKCRVWITQYQ